MTKDEVLANIFCRTIKFKSLDECYKADPTVAFAALRWDADVLEHAHSDIKNNKEIVLYALSKNGLDLKFASETLKSDKEVVIQAVSHDAYAIRFSSESLQNDFDVVLVAVSQNSCLLRHLPEKFKEDKRILLAAVNQSWQTYPDIADSFKNDPEIMLSVVKQNKSAVRYFSDDTLADIGNNDPVEYLTPIARAYQLKEQLDAKLVEKTVGYKKVKI